MNTVTLQKSQEIRQAILEAIPSSSNYGESPEPRLMYIPPAHTKALRLEANLIVGSRGVGKSFWTSVLGSPDLRARLGTTIKDLENLRKTQVQIGFSVKENLDAYPDPETFKQLLDQNFTPYEIWRTVVLRWLAQEINDVSLPKQNWASSVQWVKDNPEPFARIVRQANDKFLLESKKGLIVFDALDRSSGNWQTMDNIVRDLLKVTLWLKSYTAIHAKVFLREDQFQRSVTDFPDASKLLATKVELAWQPHDLHGLLWQTLCNAPGSNGEVLRNVYQTVMGRLPQKQNDVDIWMLADEAKRETDKQRELFEALAGPWMGLNKKRGMTYRWSVSHLADGKGQTSPRSFLEAIKAASANSSENYPEHPYPLHYESIKRGVQKASEIRIGEMEEDFPWVGRVFRPLHSLRVPCQFSEIETIWRQKFPDGFRPDPHDRLLPPQHSQDQKNWSGIQEDLQRLSIIEIMTDGRINMPDIYRVGFGLGRLGGVKRIKQAAGRKTTA